MHAQIPNTWGGHVVKGDTVWTIPPKSFIYEEAIVKDILSDGTAMVSLATDTSGPVGRICHVDFVYPYNESSAADMTQLSHITEAGILQNLTERSYQDQPYTFIGPVLVVINPLKWLPQPHEFIRARQKLSSHMESKRGEKKVQQVSDSWPRIPHPFTLAETSYQNMLFALAQHRAMHEQSVRLRNKAPPQRKETGGTDAKQAAETFTQSKSLYVNQSIVVGGESGAGKTEAAKMILSHLVERCSGDNKLHARLLLLELVLEVFGNAKTLRNSNSSRFAKFLKLHFDPTGSAIVGASVETYLLERSRICHREVGELNFHVLHIVVNAWQEGELSHYSEIDVPVANSKSKKNRKSTKGDKKAVQQAGDEITLPEFNYLATRSRSESASSGSPTKTGTLGRNGHGRTSRKVVGVASGHGRNPSTMSHTSTISWGGLLDNSKEHFTLQKLRENLEVLGIRPSQQDGIFRILQGVLFLGNILFVNAEHRAGNVAVLSDVIETKNPSSTLEGCEAALLHAAERLGVGRDDLCDALSKRTVRVGNETTETFLNAEAAMHARDALAKALYVRVFSWLVQKINKSIRGNNDDSEAQCFIGVLDIFGFESLVHNDFEQLLINYTNEALQVTFNQQIFMSELELFRREGLFEGISTSEIETLGEMSQKFHHNLDCIWLLQGTGRASRNTNQHSGVHNGAAASGILGIVDQQSRMPQACDESMLEMIHRTYGGGNNINKSSNARASKALPTPGSNCFGYVHPKHRGSMFVVQHFAGNVGYTIGNFVKKNQDNVPPQIETLVSTSQEKFVVKVWNVDAVNENEPTWEASSPRRQISLESQRSSASRQSKVVSSRNAFSRSRPQVGSFSTASTTSGSVRFVRQKESTIDKFQKQMEKLLDTLDNTRCSFVRCIKPNPQMIRQSVDISRTGTDSVGPTTQTWVSQKYVLMQMRSLNILQSVQVLQRGYPARVEYETLAELYGHWLSVKESQNAWLSRVQVAAILWAADIPSKDYKLGRSMVFFRNGRVAAINKLLREPLHWTQTKREKPKSKSKSRRKSSDSVDRHQTLDEFASKVQHFIVRRKWRIAIAAVIARRAFLQLYLERRQLDKGAEIIQRRWRRYHEALLNSPPPVVSITSISDDEEYLDSETDVTDHEGSALDISDLDSTGKSAIDRETGRKKYKKKKHRKDKKQKRSKKKKHKPRKKERNSRSSTHSTDKRSQHSKSSKDQPKRLSIRPGLSFFSKKSPTQEGSAASNDSASQRTSVSSSRASSRLSSQAMRRLSFRRTSTRKHQESTTSNTSTGITGKDSNQSARNESDTSLTQEQKEEWNITQLLIDTMDVNEDTTLPEDSTNSPSTPVHTKHLPAQQKSTSALLTAYEKRRLSIRSDASGTPPSRNGTLGRPVRSSATRQATRKPVVDLRNEIVSWAWKLSVKSQRNWKRRLLVLNKQHRTITYLAKKSSDLYGLKVKGKYQVAKDDSTVLEKTTYPNPKRIASIIRTFHKRKKDGDVSISVIEITNGHVMINGKLEKKQRSLFLAFDDEASLNEFTRGVTDAVRGFSPEDQRTAWRGAHIHIDPTMLLPSWSDKGQHKKQHRSGTSQSSSTTLNPTTMNHNTSNVAHSRDGKFTRKLESDNESSSRVEFDDSASEDNTTWGTNTFAGNGNNTKLGLLYQPANNIDDGPPRMPTVGTTPRGGSFDVPGGNAGDVGYDVVYDAATVDELLRQLENDLLEGNVDDETFETQTQYLLQKRDHLSTGPSSLLKSSSPATSRSNNSYATVMMQCERCENVTTAAPDGNSNCEHCGSSLSA